MTAEGGPSGAKGTMIKSIGNNSYGKTVETLDGIELVWSKDRPEGFNSYMAEDPLMKFVWFRKGEAILREYHQPQIGSFITAYVRMVVRTAIMLKPSAFLYADTDCVAFKEPVDLPIDAGKYGHWKLEVDGLEYQFIDKKVYCDLKAEVKHAKGMNLNNLTKEDFDQWFEGNPPKQKQLHRNNFLKVMAGIDMFVEREKVGAKNKN
jgi:hypothetical protein